MQPAIVTEIGRISNRAKHRRSRTVEAARARAYLTLATQALNKGDTATFDEYVAKHDTIVDGED